MIDINLYEILTFLKKNTANSEVISQLSVFFINLNIQFMQTRLIYLILIH